jgi:hypothetical protein
LSAKPVLLNNLNQCQHPYFKKTHSFYKRTE